MTSLREAAQAALESLQELNGWQSLAPPATSKAAVQAAIKLSAALAEPVQETGVKLKPVFYASRRLDDEELEAALQRLTDVQQEMQEPPCATRECMPSECPGCASLQDQNAELDRKLAEIERKPLTEEELSKIIDAEIGFNSCGGWEEAFARAVERAHGIGSSDE